MEPKKQKLSNYYNDFIRYCKVKNLSERTIFYYKEQWEYFRKFYNGENIKSINQNLIDNYILFLKNLGTLSNISINTRLRGLRAILNYLISKNIISNISITLIKAEKKIKITFTEDELRKLLKRPNVKKCRFSLFRNWVIVNYMLATGNRASTIVNLKISDLDFDNFFIRIHNFKRRKEILIPMSYSLAYILHDYLEYRDYKKEDDYLFIKEDGGKMDTIHLGQEIRRYNYRKGLKKGSLHIYRHTFAKLWILNGGDEFRLQKILGHETMQMTREYVNMFSQDLKKDFEKFNPLDNLKTSHTLHMKRDYTRIEKMRDYRKRKKQGNKGE